MKLRLPKSETLMVWACVMALVGLALMLWSVFSPTVWPIMIAVSLGQVIGTASFALFLLVVARDLQVERALRKRGASEPGAATGGDGEDTRDERDVVAERKAE